MCLPLMPAAMPGVALRFIDIVESGKAGSMILCAPNQGAIPGLRDNDIVEITCDIAPDSCTPHKVTDGDRTGVGTDPPGKSL